MKEKTLSAKVKARLVLLLEALNALPAWVPFGHKEAVALFKDEETFTLSKWKTLCDEVISNPILAVSGLFVELNGTTLICRENREESVRASRAKLWIKEKNAISEFLWSWLYDRESILPHQEGRSAANFPEVGFKATCNWKVIDRVHSHLETKREIFRARSVAEIVIDAGTTTKACAQAFLTAKNLPLVTRSPMGLHLTRPSIVTNCIETAYLFSKHSKRSELQLRVIGGMEHRERQSICGDSALQWLKVCRGQGKHAVSDLSIIGTTGFISEGHRALPSFGCDDPQESELKSELLQHSQLRVIVMDSTKATFRSNIGCFASLSPHEVDLVITDSGTSHGGEDSIIAKNVRHFMKQAALHGVPVIAVSLDERVEPDDEEESRGSRESDSSEAAE